MTGGLWVVPLGQSVECFICILKDSSWNSTLKRKFVHVFWNLPIGKIKKLIDIMSCMQEFKNSPPPNFVGKYSIENRGWPIEKQKYRAWTETKPVQKCPSSCQEKDKFSERGDQQTDCREYRAQAEVEHLRTIHGR